MLILAQSHDVVTTVIVRCAIVTPDRQARGCAHIASFTDRKQFNVDPHHFSPRPEMIYESYSQSVIPSAIQGATVVTATAS
jgi:hypothetical protein